MKPVTVEKLSKTMSYALRHHPEEFALAVSESGQVHIKLLAEALSSKLAVEITVAEILHVVEQDSKQRFTVTGELIKAAQGHSFPVQLGLVAQVPPATLFHGTIEAFVPSIMSEGLKAGKRQQVHLSASHETAVTVGSRRGTPTVLIIEALKAHESGIQFFLTENSVWLTDHVPAEFVHSEH